MEPIDRLGTIAGRAPMPVLGLDRDGRLTYANDSLCALTGYDRDELIGKLFWEFMPDRAGERIRRRFLRLRDDGFDTRFDAHIAARDGGNLRIAWHNVSFFDRDGKLESVYSIGADVTALRSAENRLKQLNTMLRALGEISRLALRTDDPGDLLRQACEVLVSSGACTGAWIALLGDDRRPVGLVGSPLPDGTPPETQHSALSRLPECIAGVLEGSRPQVINRPSRSCESCVFSPDAPDVQGIATAIGLGDRPSAVLVTHVRNSRPVGEETMRLFCTIADDLGFALAMLEARAMHERTEQSLAERTRLLDAFFASSLDPAAILDREFTFLRVNEAYAHSCGMSSGELLGRNHFELFPHAENQRIFERVRDTGEPYVVHAKPFEFPDDPGRGTTYWDWTVVPIPDENGEVDLLSLWLRDVTEEQRAVQALEAQRDRLDETVTERTDELQQTNDLLRTILAASPIAVTVLDPDGNVDLWNPAAEAISGWSEDEVLGEQPPLVSSDKREEFQRNLRHLAEGGRIEGVSFERERRDGARLQLDLFAAPLHSSDGQHIGSVVLFSDATDRVRAEQDRQRLMEQLQEERATLDTIIRNAPQGIVLADEEARLTLVNPAAEALYRRPAPLGEDRKVHARLGLCYPNGMPYEVDDLPVSRSALRGEVVHNEAMAIVWPDGQRRDLLVNSAPVRVPEGGISGAVGVFQDITEIKDNERERERLMDLLEDYADHLEDMVAERTREVAESRDQLRTQRDFVDAVIENAGSLVVVVDARGRIVRFNHAAEQVSGWSADQARGRDFIELLIPEEDREQVREDFGGLLRDGISDYEVTWQCADGDQRRVSWRVNTIPGRDEEMDFMIGTGWDVTDERRMQRDLRESEEKYRELVERARTIIIRWDLDGTITFVNEYGLELFGYSESEMIGRHVSLIVPDVDSRGEDLTGLVKAIVESPEEYWTNENENVAKDGTRHWISWSNRIIRDRFGQMAGIMAIGADRTAQKRAEEQLELSRQDLRDLTAELAIAEQRERREIATVLHDNIGQLLAFAKMKLGGMMERQALDERVLSDVLRYVDEAIAETRSLTSQLSPPALEQLGFVPALEWLCDDLAEHHGLAVSFEAEVLPEEPSEEVSVTLFQATRELIVNAIKHSQAGQVRARLWVNDSHVCIEVADDGAGFDPGVLKERKQRGGGFGLLNVQERISYLGGEMQIDAAPGQGTTITLICPINLGETSTL